MKIYTTNNIPPNNKVSFGSLKIKDSKKWPKADLELLQNNSEVKKLVAYAEKEGVDIVAEYYHPINMNNSGIISLKNSYDFTFGYYSSNSFKYDLFKASNCKLQIKEKGFTAKVSENKSNAIHFTKKLCKSIKDYAKSKLSKLKSIPGK